MPVADSCWYLAEANGFLQSNYPSIKKVYFKQTNKQNIPGETSGGSEDPN